MKFKETARRLRHALDRANLKAQELADRSGVSKASVSQYVNGTHTPSNVSAGKMGKVLGVNPMWLMGFDVEMTEELKYILESDNAVDVIKGALSKSGYYKEDFTDEEVMDIMKYADFVLSRRKR